MNNEKNINAQEVNQPNTDKPDANQTAAVPEISPEEHLNRISTGKMKLLQPIRAAGQDITELKWNFRNLTGWEFASAMDCDSASNVFRITNKQALGLFAASAAKETTIKNDGGVEIHPLDAQDIRQRIGIDDCVKAVQLAAVFFVASAKEANKRISSM
ncbi:MAG: hypothetical protein IKK75_07935 [Clostridia bacterium]|nr:hypothetical protein [Clostridia bacterium]